jgi:sulfur-carrier protein
MKIHVFGQLIDVVEGSEILLEDKVQTVHNLKEVLFEKIPALQQKTFRIAVNNKIVDDENSPLNHGDKIALMPPFSGG